MIDSREILQTLKQRQIDYQVINHPPVHTAAEADRYVQGYDFIKAKNLFLHAKSSYYLVILPDDHRLDMKALRKRLGSGRLSFASDQELFAKLGIKSGAVSPFNLLNNHDHDVTVVLDKGIADQPTQRFGCHPNDNTKPVLLTVADLLTLIKQWGNPLKIVDCQ